MASCTGVACDVARDSEIAQTSLMGDIGRRVVPRAGNAWAGQAIGSTRARTSIRRHATVAIYCFSGAATGKGEDQRTILPSLNLIV